MDFNYWCVCTLTGCRTDKQSLNLYKLLPRTEVGAESRGETKDKTRAETKDNNGGGS